MFVCFFMYSGQESNSNITPKISLPFLFLKGCMPIFLLRGYQIRIPYRQVDHPKNRSSILSELIWQRLPQNACCWASLCRRESSSVENPLTLF